MLDKSTNILTVGVNGREIIRLTFEHSLEPRNIDDLCALLRATIDIINQPPHDDFEILGKFNPIRES